MKKSSLEKGTIGGAQSKAKRAKSQTSTSKAPKKGGRSGSKSAKKSKQITAPALPYRNRKKAIKAQKAAEAGEKRFYSDLRLKQKAANERMRQLELKGIKSPAYMQVQAQLEILGRRTKGDRGRRFSETGKATYNEMELLNKILDQFLNAKTSTLTGAKQYEKDVWETANINNKLSEAGITKNQWLNFWAAMPDRKDRMFGSEQYVAMIRAYSMKNGKLEDMNKLSVEQIAEEIEAQDNLKAAYKAIGLTYKEVNSAKIKKDKKPLKLKYKNYNPFEDSEL